MGLLDEAIREHLDLKRRRGADPSAVAREEREALAPVIEDVPVSSAADDDHEAEAVYEAPAGNAVEDAPEAKTAGDPPAVERVYVEEAPTEAHALATPVPAPDQEPLDEHPAISQETAELDMQLVIDGDNTDLGSTEEPQGHLKFP